MITVTTNLCVDKILEHKLGQVVEVKDLERYMEQTTMSEVEFRKHRVFRETEDVIFYDISVEESNGSDLVVHTGAACIST